MPTDADPRTVLIVEDDLRLATLWRDELEAAGLRVVLEDNPERAIRRLREETFAVAVLDLLLSRSGGDPTEQGSLMLLAYLGLNAFRAPKVLAVSGYEEMTEYFQTHGILAPGNTLLKPIDPAALRERVLQLIARRDREREATEMADQRYALQRFKFAADTAQEAIYWVREDGGLLYVNDAACQLLGHPRERLLGMPIGDISPDHQGDGWADAWRRVKQEGFVEQEATHVDARGARLSTHVHAHYYNFEGDEFVVVAARDVSDLKRRSAELERANAHLQEFSYAVSHDLKAPLRSIHLLTEWLTDDLAGMLPEQSVGHLRQLRGRVDRMERLLDDLVVYWRAGADEGAAQRLALGELLDAILEVQPPGGRFEVRRELAVEAINAVRTPLETVLRNLIGNAVKHHDRDRGVIVVAAEPLAGAVEFTVTDDGPGIPEEYRERVFRMFQSLRPRDEVEGTGIGLSLARKLVNAAGGVITIESAEPRGTRVRFTWPTTAKHAIARVPPTLVRVCTVKPFGR